MAFLAFRAPRLRQPLCRTILSLSLRSWISRSITPSFWTPVRPKEMAATARMLGSSSSSSRRRASITAVFWNLPEGHTSQSYSCLCHSHVVHSPRFSTAVRRTVDCISNTSFMLSFSAAVWLTISQKMFFSLEWPLICMKWSFVIVSAPPNSSSRSISINHLVFSSKFSVNKSEW